MSQRTFTDAAPLPPLTGMQPHPQRASTYTPALNPEEARRAACVHGPWLSNSHSGETCARCGAAHPDSWSARCRRGVR